MESKKRCLLGDEEMGGRERGNARNNFGGFGWWFSLLRFVFLICFFYFYYLVRLGNVLKCSCFRFTLRYPVCTISFVLLLSNARDVNNGIIRTQEQGTPGKGLIIHYDTAGSRFFFLSAFAKIAECVYHLSTS
ncbi:hypothetical protein V8C34DRAFT_285268 [Trichoderma compactum]